MAIHLGEASPMCQPCVHRGLVVRQVMRDGDAKLFLGCRFGPIHSMRHLPRKFCAFINYTQQEAAEAAYATLQVSPPQGREIRWNCSWVPTSNLEEGLQPGGRDLGLSLGRGWGSSFPLLVLCGGGERHVVPPCEDSSPHGRKGACRWSALPPLWRSDALGSAPGP